MSSRTGKTWARDTLARYMPGREELARNRYLAPIAHRFLSPGLWRFTRRSVPRGVALGLFCAFIVPVGQIFLAAFMALPFRANVPLAALTTFITNPFTFPFWAVVANRVGDLLLSVDQAATGGAATQELASGRWSWFLDVFAEVGVTVLVTTFGFVVLAVVTSLVGWVLSGFVWRIMVGRRRARRLARMEESLDKRLAEKGTPTP